MSNVEAKNKENVKGTFYCTEGCIACNACYGRAPQFFAENDEGSAYVWRQPETEEDIIECQEQLDNCPVSAIGRDGV